MTGDPANPQTEEQMSTETKLTKEHQAVVDRLIELQQQLAKSDKIFCRDHLSYTDSTWNKIRNGQYWAAVKRPDDVLVQLTRDLRVLEREVAIASRFQGDRKFHEFDEFAAVLKSIRRCRAKGMHDPDRLVVFLADTGGGKSALCARILGQFNAVVVEAREAWKKSYFNCVKDVAAALNLDIGGINMAATIEDMIAETLLKKRMVLAIDEAEFFGPQALNFIKQLLNRTPTVIVLCAIPSAFDKWNQWYKHEAAQLRRRTHIMIRQDRIQPKEAEVFLENLGLNGHRKEAGVLLAKAANNFGRFDIIQRVVDDLTEAGHIDLEEVQKSIQRVQAQMGV